MPENEILKSIEEGQELTGHRTEIYAELLKKTRNIVILDDDPTGTQTVFDVPVVTEWEEEILEKELLASPVFFILTNSRSLQASEANALGKLIGERLKAIAAKFKRDLVVISRSDSTLRGHYPNEVDALADGLGWPNAKLLLIPAFFEGGRYTYKNVHYVKEGDTFVPASETPFAKDNTFGYKSSNLIDWIIEKSGGVIPRNKIENISIDTLRNSSIAYISSILERPASRDVVVNATSYADLQIIALACLRATGFFIYRTAASFVNAISGIEPRECLPKNEILQVSSTNGALIVIGSYVPKTTAQLEHLKEYHTAVYIELKVDEVLETRDFQKTLSMMAKEIDEHIRTGKDVVLYTSRKVIKGANEAKSLEIVNLISNGLIRIVKQLMVQPKYVLAKGGITSSDIATKGLSVKRAKVLGQVLKGVPVWQLEEETKFLNMPYIVFPGNVGDEKALYNVIKLLE